MIMYIKQMEDINFICKIFSILKKDEIDNRNIIYIPINNKTAKRKVKKVAEKLSKYLYESNVKNVVLELELMKNEELRNILYSYNIHILDGTRLSKFLIHNVVKKIYKYKNKKIETGELTVLANDNNDVTVENIMILSKRIKRLNIITSNTKKFKKMVEYLYNELGILIKLTNNFTTNLNNSDIIINIDFPEELINRLEIPNNGIIVNLPRNININSKKFAGINIQNWEIEIPTEYNIQDFDSKIMYEAKIYEKPTLKVFEQIETDKIKVKKLIGINGIISKKEFI